MTKKTRKRQPSLATILRKLGACEPAIRWAKGRKMDEATYEAAKLVRYALICGCASCVRGETGQNLVAPGWLQWLSGKLGFKLGLFRVKYAPYAELREALLKADRRRREG